MVTLWQQTAKANMMQTGQNPEANVSRAEGTAARGQSLSTAMCLFKTEEQVAPWLTVEEVIDACRNKKGPKDIHQLGKVKVLGPGLYEVNSEGGEKNYRVELDIADLGPRPVRTMVVGCTCMDHIRMGPVCKHAGAAFLELAGGRRRAEERSGGRGSRPCGREFGFDSGTARGLGPCGVKGNYGDGGVRRQHGQHHQSGTDP